MKPSLALQDALDALESYILAVSLFLWFDRGRSKDSEDIPLINSLDDKVKSKADTEEEVEQVSGQVYLNEPGHVSGNKINTALAFHSRQAREMVSACFSNIALCLLKTLRFQDAVYACK